MKYVLKNIGKKIKLFNFLFLFVFIFYLTSYSFAGSKNAVLFDNAHLESIGNANWTITGGYSDFADTIRSLGIKVDETKKPITLELLKNYDAYIVPEPNVKFSPEEEKAIIEYVKQGGGLYMISDHFGSDRNNDGWDSVQIFNNFATNFGLKFDEKWVKKEMPIRGKFNNDLITYNVKYCGTWGGTTISILDPSIARGHIFLSEQNSGGAYIATANYGDGRVVALGDSSPFDDGSGDDPKLQLIDGYNLLEADHKQLAINTICFLLNKDPKEYQIPLKLYYEGGKLNCNPGELKEFKFVVLNQTNNEYKNLIISFYKNKINDKNKLYSVTLDRLAAKEKKYVMFPFKDNDRKLMFLYVTLNSTEDKNVKFSGLTSIMVGVPIMVYLDSVHENDYNNRIKMLKNALSNDGMFYTRSKDVISDNALSKVDVLIINAPKKGYKLRDNEILAIINHLKKGRGLLLHAKGPHSNWGDNLILNEILKALSIPASFENHPEISNPNQNIHSFQVLKNDYIVLQNYNELIKGEAPAMVKLNEDELKKQGFKWQVITTLPQSKIPVDVIIDGSEIGYGKIGLFGSFHLSDKAYNDFESLTYTFNIKTLRALAPQIGAFNSSQIPDENKVLKNNILRGIFKAYANGIIYIEDFGIKKEVYLKQNNLSEEEVIKNIEKFKGKLVRLNLLPFDKPMINSFEDIVLIGK